MLEKELTVLQSIDTFLENIFRHIFFQFNTLKGTTKALAVDICGVANGIRKIQGLGNFCSNLEISEAF